MLDSKNYNPVELNWFVIIFALILISSGFIVYGESNQAADFYAKSDVRVNYDGEGFYLRLDTPVPVLCAVNFGPEDGTINSLTAMEMVSPARDHDIRLELERGQQYSVILTAFTKAHKIFRSREYIVSTASPQEGKDLIDSSSGDPKVLHPEEAEKAFSAPPVINDVQENRVTISFVSNKAALASTAFGKTEKFGRQIRSARTEPFRERELKVLGLKTGAKYFTETILINSKGKLFRSKKRTFETLKEPDDEVNYGKNWASLTQGASISSVSSNWGSDPSGPFGASNAIDGDPGSEWSSQGEGNDAWIEVKLPDRIKITAIGFWTRTMGNTGQVSKIRVLTGKGKLLGEFSIPSANEVYRFQTETHTTDLVRFEVLKSSGGNTGAREIKVYGSKPD